MPVHVHVRAKLLQSRPTPCDPMDCSPPGSSVHGVLQEGVMEWVAVTSPRGPPPPRDGTCVPCGSCTGRWALYYWGPSGSLHTGVWLQRALGRGPTEAASPGCWALFWLCLC